MMTHVRAKAAVAVLVMFGLMSIGAASSQAGQYLIESFGEKKTLGQLGISKEKVLGGQVGEGRLILPGRGAELACQNADVTGEMLATEALVTVNFLGCKVFLIEKFIEKGHEYPLKGELNNCKLKSGGTVTATARVVPVLHDSEIYLLASPPSGSSTFAVISFESGMGCVLPLNNPVEGSVVALMRTEHFLFQPIDFTPKIQLLLNDKLQQGMFNAHLEGSGAVALSGELINSGWGAH
jgi:hypothetical protein